MAKHQCIKWNCEKGSGPVMIFAHRGASGYAPENTMAAFRLALDMGSEGIELDIQQTKDGRIVICHDDDIKRTSNGQGFIKDFTLEELQRFDAGGWFDEKFQGEKIPTLREFLDLVCDTSLIINIEIKNIPFYYEGIEEKLIRVITEYDMVDRVIISSFDHYALQKVAQLDGSLKTGMLFSTRVIDPWKYVQQLAFKAYSIHPHLSFVNQEYTAQCHAHGYKVYAYTVDQPEWYELLTKAGIDGVFTNYPDRWKSNIQ